MKNKKTARNEKQQKTLVRACTSGVHGFSVRQLHAQLLRRGARRPQKNDPYGWARVMRSWSKASLKIRKEPTLGARFWPCERPGKAKVSSSRTHPQYWGRPFNLSHAFRSERRIRNLAPNAPCPIVVLCSFLQRLILALYFVFALVRVLEIFWWRSIFFKH